MGVKEIFLQLKEMAPDLIPLIVSTVIDVEALISGIGKGDVKKGRVMSIIQSVLATKDYFFKSGTGRQNEILNLVGGTIDLLVGVFNLTGLFTTSKKIDFTPVPPADDPQGGESGRARLGGMMLTLAAVLFFAFLPVAGCGQKELTPATEVVYEGPMAPGADEWSFASAKEMAETCNRARTCMGVAEDLPLPGVRGMKGGNAVDCGGVLRQACYMPGLVIAPEGGELDLIAHECVHHWLYVTTGDLDAEHESEFFLTCGGKFMIQNDTPAPAATPGPAPEQ